ncbi:MAG: hypothetical protein HDR03_03045 [Lachnospiraceae bacterium]|nr:hypothetical protein [Lachnospiraceae bacterium]
MWVKTDEISRKLNIGESCHNLYAIGEDDKVFWEADYPFLFVSMIQLRMEDEVEQNIAYNKFKDFLTQKINDNNHDIKFSIYHSLDSCDLILFLKTKLYELGSKLIQEMPSIPYQDKQTLNYYCYSLCGIDIESFKKTDISQDINKIMICFVIRNFALFNQWLGELEKKFPCIEEDQSYRNNINRQIIYSRLGNEDVCINIMKCDLGRFLKELSEEGGLLNESNELFAKGLMKLRLHFDTSLYPGNSLVNCSKETYFQTLVDKFNQKIVKVDEILYPATRKALIEVLNSCSYFEQEHFVKDIQVCIQNSFDIFLSKFDEYIAWEAEKNEKDNYSKIYTKISFNDSVIEFINGIMSVINGALHTDRMFFQAPGFNAVLYDIPAKLLAFYTAYVMKIVEILNDSEEKEFAYLLCPDLYLEIVISKLFDNPLKCPTKRLLKGNIPVKSIFAPKQLMMELAHEVAHCVSDDVRRRDIRMKITEVMLADIITNQLFKYSGVNKQKDKEILSILFSQNGNLAQIRNTEVADFEREISGYISNWFDTEFIRDCDVRDEFTFYQVKTKKFFKYKLKELLQNPNGLFSFIEDKYIEKFIFNDDLAEKVEKIYALNTIMESNLQTLQTDSDYMYRIIEVVHSLTSESYSDLIMCKMLGLSGKEYIFQFFEINQELLDSKGFEFLYANATGERIVSVLEALGEDINSISADGDYLYSCYLDRIKNFNESDESKRNKSILLPKKVIKDNVYYLKKCLEKIQEKGLDNKFTEMRNIYNDVTRNDMFTSTQTIFKSVHEMRIKVDEGLLPNP